MFLKIEDILNNLCFIQECIDWAKDERRTFLRQSLESRLIGLYFETERFTDALALGATLLKELKKLDDKNLLVEVILSVISIDPYVLIGLFLMMLILSHGALHLPMLLL